MHAVSRPCLVRPRSAWRASLSKLARTFALARALTPLRMDSCFVSSQLSCEYLWRARLHGRQLHCVSLISLLYAVLAYLRDVYFLA